jgi:5-(carboxyamino)imidazole ribonucleotide mutase
MATHSNESNPQVGIIMGSISDLETMREAVNILEMFEIPHEMRVVSAHRTPDLLVEYATTAAERGLEVIIAGAGGAAHLPGMTAAMTILPVIGVPIQTKTLQGLDSLLSIVQMPAGVPVATMAIGNAKNAGLMAARILGIKYPAIVAKLKQYAETVADEVKALQI